MKKYIYILVLLFWGNHSFAQDKNLRKNIDKAIESNEVIIEALKRQVAELESQYNILRDSLGNLPKRNFSPISSEEDLRKYLGNFKTLDTMYVHLNDVRKILSRFKGLPLADIYALILNMQESIHEVYNKSTNNEFKAKLERIKPLEQHQADFEKLNARIKDYRFVMFELARVFKIIDGKKTFNSKELYAELESSEETEYIHSIPYADTVLWQYINNHCAGGSYVFKETMQKLIEACPEAFSDFK